MFKHVTPVQSNCFKHSILAADRLWNCWTPTEVHPLMNISGSCIQTLFDLYISNRWRNESISSDDSDGLVKSVSKKIQSDLGYYTLIQVFGKFSKIVH